MATPFFLISDYHTHLTKQDPEKLNNLYHGTQHLGWKPIPRLPLESLAKDPAVTAVSERQGTLASLHALLMSVAPHPTTTSSRWPAGEASSGGFGEAAWG